MIEVQHLTKRYGRVTAVEDVSFRVEQDIIERLRNAVWHLGRGITVTSVMEEAMAKAIRDLEKRNNGKPFPARGAPLPKAPRKVR